MGQNNLGSVPPGVSPYGAEDDEDEPGGPVPPGGRWVSRGGVLSWQEPPVVEGAPLDARAEAESRWAADEVELPPGAGMPVRIRAVRAWLLRQRQLENEALGVLLLARRQAAPAGEPPTNTAARRGIPEESPLELEMAEHQAAAAEYERLFELLAELETHNGPPRLLVEFYLALTERLAELASAPEAAPDFAPHLRVAQRASAQRASAQRVEPRAAVEWQGRVSAVTLTRRRVERVTQPEVEE
jgi:hypothetical protein